jgi:integrase
VEAAQEEAKQKRITFADAAAQYIESRGKSWTRKTLSQFRGSMTLYVLPTIGSMQVHQIETAQVLEVISKLWHDKPTTAGRVRNRIEQVLNWAKAQDYRSGENPARWKGHLENVLPAIGDIHQVEHYAALPYAQLADFMVRLRAREGLAPRALEFLILTAARSNEVLTAEWSELDLLDNIWIVPARKMKSRREHRVPLTAPAIAVLRQIKPLQQNQWIFPGLGGKPLNQMTMLVRLRSLQQGLTVHGFRATFRTWAAEKTHFPREVIEVALAHTVGDETERAYQRGDLFAKRVQLMQAWADFIEHKSAEVIPLRA